MEEDFHSERFTLSAENLSYRQVLEMIAISLHKRPPKIRATPFLISVAWRLNWLVSRISGKPRRITRDAVISSKRIALFSSEKIRQAIGMDFIPVKQSIEDTANHFLNTVRARKG
jgi:hypothetical protein